MSTGYKHNQYYPTLDGLRGLAIILVVTYHNFGFINFSVFGWLGVDLFFVLSGFLITNILLNSLGKKDYLKNFYVKRILRIFPLYYLSLAIFLFVTPVLFQNIHSDYFRQNQIYIWTYLQNWLYSFKPTNQTLLHHYWSLAVEEQYYLVWPFVILLIKNKRVLLFITLLLLVSVNALRVIVWSMKADSLSYLTLYTFSRIDGLCIGSAISLLMSINKNFLSKYTAHIIASVAALNFLFYFINDEKTFPYLAFIGYTTIAIVFGIFIYESVIGKTSIINIIFNNAILRLFGRISYGFYILHWPLYLYLSPELNKFFSQMATLPPSLIPFLSSVFATSVAFLISLLSFKYFESYFLRLKEKFN